MFEQASTTTRILKATAGLSCALATTTIAWVILWPIKTENFPDAVSRSNENASTPSKLNPGGRENPISKDKNSSNQLAQCDWQRRLRWAQAESSVPAPTLEPAVASPPKPNQLQLNLLGTMVERERSFALLQDNRGETDLQPVGGTLQLQPAGLRIAQIHRDHVVIEQGNRQIKIDISSAAAEPEMPIDEGAVTAEMLEEPPEFTNIDDELDWLNGDMPETDDNSSSEGSTEK